jgi:hypothetical protein
LLNAVDGVTHYVEEPPLDAFAGGHLNGSTGVNYSHAALQSVGTVHGDGPDPVFAQVLLTFEHQLGAVGSYNFKGVKYLG